MKQRIRNLVLALLALTLVLAGATAAAEDSVVITLSGVSQYEVDDFVYMNWLEEKFNVDFQCNFFTTDAWQTQFTLMLADDNLPDMLLNVSIPKAEADKYGADGYLLDLTTCLDKMPNYAALLEKDAALAAFSKDQNGAIYGIYKTRDSLCSREVSMAYMNKNWLANVGMEYPTTTEELYQVLKAFKEQDANGNGDPNDEIPLSLTIDAASGQRGEYTLRSAFGIYGYQNNYQLQVTDDKVWLAETSENWKEYVKYMHRLYAEGLLDADCFIQTNDEYLAKITNGKVGYFANWNTLDRVFGTEDRRVYLDYRFVTGFTSDLTDEIIYPLWNPVTETAVDVISASASPEVIDKICEIVDYFYTEQGMIDASICCDGVDGKLVEGPYGTLTADGTGYYEDSGLSYTEWRYAHSLVNNAFMVVQYSRGQRIVDEASDEELARLLEEASAAEDLSHQVLLVDAFKDYYVRQVKTCSDYPQVTYTAEEQAERSVLMMDIKNYIQTMKAQFIVGEVDVDAGWDAFLTNLKNMQLDRLLEIEQQAYDRYASRM